MSTSNNSYPFVYVDRLLTAEHLNFSESAEAVAGAVQDISNQFTMYASMDYAHTHVENGVGFHWQPRYQPDECVLRSDINPVLKNDVAVINPFSKDSSTFRLIDIALIELHDDEQFARYDIFPDGSDVEISLFYKRERIISAGKSLLRLSFKNR